jgi:uncharacterized protein YqhQ
MDSIGGQAVIEGVMLRSNKHVSIAVRAPDGKVKVRAERFHSLLEKHPILKWPFIRGIINMYEMLKLGIKSLVESGEIAGDEELSGTATWTTVLVSVVLAIGLFMALPYFLTTWIGLDEETSSIMFNFIDGLIKLTLLVVYLWAISLMDDVKRLFQYHGAEHKVVHAHESGRGVTLQNAKKYSVRHPRCGTSFIFLVFFIMILVFSLIPSIARFFVPSFADLGFVYQRLLLFSFRFALLIPVISISYELLKLSAKYGKNPLFQALAYPGMLIQRLTTREPTAKQIEVAMEAMNAILRKETKRPKVAVADV